MYIDYDRHPLVWMPVICKYYIYICMGYGWLFLASFSMMPIQPCKSYL